MLSSIYTVLDDEILISLNENLFCTYNQVSRRLLLLGISHSLVKQTSYYPWSVRVIQTSAILPDPFWGQSGLHTDVRLVQMNMYESSSSLSSKLVFSEVDSLVRPICCSFVSLSYTPHVLTLTRWDLSVYTHDSSFRV